MAETEYGPGSPERVQQPQGGKQQKGKGKGKKIVKGKPTRIEAPQGGLASGVTDFKRLY